MSQPPGLLDLLIRLEEAGAVPVRHGAFVGCLRPERVPRALWDLVRRHQGALARMLSNSPTPYRQRRAAS
jgi:hypothetical protein